VTEHHPEDEVDQYADPPEPEATGADPRIAAAVARLDGLGNQPPVEHVAVYEEVHGVLQESLADATHSTDSTDERPESAQP
jgi:hypothetical protein